MRSHIARRQRDGRQPNRMRRAAFCVLSAALLAGAVRCLSGDEDGESDGAPFAIAVAHEDRWLCGGSLVSARTALTSAWCAGGVSARSLWAHSVATRHPDSVRRVTRIVLASDEHGQANPRDVEKSGWFGALFDLALLEMESPFGKQALARPIVMATEAADCPEREQCTVARLLAGRGRIKVRVVDVQVAAPAACAAARPHWAAVRDSALCLRGATLCRSDRGAGVVCGGKLCAVLSRSTDDSGGCGDTHAAHATARWRGFLRCAHTLRACGRDNCARVCIERNLIAETASETTESEPIPTPPRRTNDATDATEGVTASSAPQREDVTVFNARSNYAAPVTGHAHRVLSESSSIKSTRRTASSHREPPSGGRRVAVAGRNMTRIGASARPSVRPSACSPALSLRPFLDWEPNRADFKAGEYGDNAAEYGGWEPMGGGVGGASRAPTRTSASGATTASPVRLVDATAPRPTAPRPRADCSPRVASLSPLLHFLLTLLSTCTFANCH